MEYFAHQHITIQLVMGVFVSLFHSEDLRIFKEELGTIPIVIAYIFLYIQGQVPIIHLIITLHFLKNYPLSHSAARRFNLGSSTYRSIIWSTLLLINERFANYVILFY